MQNDKIYFDILSLISLETEKDQLVNQIENLSQAIYKVGGGEARRVIEENMDLRVVEILKTVPADQLPGFLTSLKEKINSIDVAKVTLSFHPKVSFVKKLHNLIVESLNTQAIVIDIQVDPEIIGGLIMELRGKFTDLTIRKKINEYI